MDERTRRTNDDLTPAFRRIAPEPQVKVRPRWKFRIGLGLIALLLALAVYETVHWLRAPAPAGGRSAQGGLQTVGAATIGLSDIRVIVNELGTVTPIATVTVQSQISGYLTQVPYKDGQMVQK